MATTYAIPDGRTVMAATTYTGNNSTNTITNTVNGVSMKPDMVWLKSRSSVTNHVLDDSSRGAGVDLYPNLTNAQSSTGVFTAFNTNGFSLGADGGGSLNGNALTYVAWQWQAGQGSTSSNTSGSITSTVGVNASAGFSIVTWEGNSTNGATIGHGLGVAPSVLITKSRTNASSWTVGIGGISGYGVNDYLSLNTTDAVSSSTTFYQAYGINTFTVGVSAANEMNKTGNNYVTYCFAQVAGYSAFGKYAGNSSTNGPFIYTGFRPRFLMIKNTGWTNANSEWLMHDTARDPYNVSQLTLAADSTTSEFSGANQYIDILSNGFKLRNLTGAMNDSTYSYMYMAFAENPFKYANAR